MNHITVQYQFEHWEVSIIIIVAIILLCCKIASETALLKIAFERPNYWICIEGLWIMTAYFTLWNGHKQKNRVQNQQIYLPAIRCARSFKYWFSWLLGWFVRPQQHERKNRIRALTTMTCANYKCLPHLMNDLQRNKCLAFSADVRLASATNE